MAVADEIERTLVAMVTGCCHGRAPLSWLRAADFPINDHATPFHATVALYYYHYYFLRTILC